MRGYLLLLFFIALSVGCSDVRLARQDNFASFKTLYGDLKPVLAVRNPACIMCHAKIDGDLIVDFGYGEPFFFGQDNPTNHPQKQDTYGPFANKHFIHGANLWKTSAVSGNIYVPNATLTHPEIIAAHNNPLSGNTPKSQVSVVEFLKNPFTFTDPFNAQNIITSRVIDYTQNPDLSVKGLRGDFVERRNIWIDAATEEEIRSLFYLPDSRFVAMQIGAVVYKGSPHHAVSGLAFRQSDQTRQWFVSHEDVLTCRGDLIIDGVVFFKNLKLKTDNNGCRIYSTGSVFIQGPIEYVGSGTHQNLQISSARAIIIGMKTVTTRLTMEATTHMVGGLRRAWTDDQELAFNLKIIEDRNRVSGLTNDAGPFRVMYGPDKTTVIAVMDDPDVRQWVAAPGVPSFPPASECGHVGQTGKSCYLSWAVGYNRKTVNYKHLLLNAPKVYGRYYGVLEGVVISEDPLFAVSKFEFRHDPVMNEVPLLPLVRDRVFQISDD